MAHFSFASRPDPNYPGAPRYAGFFLRICASLFDWIIYIGLTYLILTAFNEPLTAWLGPYKNSFSYSFTTGKVTNTNWEWLLLFLSTAYFLGFWWVRGATPGKMIFAYKIVDADTGKRLSLIQCIKRLLGYILSIFLLFLGFLWILFDSRKQGFHDKIANTVVVKVELEPPSPTADKDKRTRTLEYTALDFK